MAQRPQIILERKIGIGTGARLSRQLQIPVRTVGTDFGGP